MAGQARWVVLSLLFVQQVSANSPPCITGRSYLADDLVGWLAGWAVRHTATPHLGTSAQLATFCRHSVRYSKQMILL